MIAANMHNTINHGIQITMEYVLVEHVSEEKNMFQILLEQL